VTVAENDTYSAGTACFNEQQDTQRGVVTLHFYFEIYFPIHEEKSNKMQQCIKIILFHIYMELNMFRATHRPSSGA